MLRLILGQFITHIEMLIPVDMLLQNGDAIYKGSVNQRKIYHSLFNSSKF